MNSLIILSEIDLIRSVAGDWPESDVLFKIYHSIRILILGELSPVWLNVWEVIIPYKILFDICSLLTFYSFDINTPYLPPKLHLFKTYTNN